VPGPGDVPSQTDAAGLSVPLEGLSFSSKCDKADIGDSPEGGDGCTTHREGGALTTNDDARLPAETEGSGAPDVPAPEGMAVAPQPYAPVRGHSPRAFELTGAEQFWYVLHCIWFGAGYFAKIPTKKALSDLGLTQLTTWEQIWYAVECVWFGAGYLAKVPAKKALNEAGLTDLTGAEQFWYVLLCIWFGAGYFAKVPMRKALSDVRLIRMTDAAQFWYVLECIAYAAGYFAKVFHKKALSELPRLPEAGVPF